MNTTATTTRLADQLLRTTYKNPFSDIQARNFQDKKIASEFIPTSVFWTLFNDQHEMVIGTRGSGKTILMRMMRYSMLKTIKDPRAERLVRDKEFFALYAPLRYEFMKKLTTSALTETQQSEWFCFAVNCLIADSLIVELKSLLSDCPFDQQLTLEYELTCKMSSMWGLESKLRKSDLNELRSAVRKMFYSYHTSKPLPETVPPAFLGSICSALAAVNVEISDIMNFSVQPTWIVCLDEAEFVEDNHMNHIRDVMRSESQHIAIKVADLPYYHDMSSPKEQKIHATVGNDYKLTLVKINEKEFAAMTNSLCKTRLQTYFQTGTDISLENFLGAEGNDDYLDYFKVEFPNSSSDADIRDGILRTISTGRRRTAEKEENKQILTQSIYKKLAPIYYIREMYKRSLQGNAKPGWFAGAKMIRRICNSNPRVFLRIMDALFDKAQSTKLTPKVQSETLLDFSKKYRKESKVLEKCGPEVAEKMSVIGESLRLTTHEGPLKESGTTFRFQGSEFEMQREWISIAIANSRLFVDEVSLRNGLTSDSQFDISNVYSVFYWIPMRRNSNCPRISVSQNLSSASFSYTVTKPKRAESVYEQMDILEEMTGKDDNR